MQEIIKNIGIFAHVDAGKTTLTEQLLYHTGAIRHLGRVDHGNTQTDSLDLERERGISIISMPTSYNYQGQKVNIIDTPGHVDFVAEVERSMLVLDGAILVISAREGVQSHTKLLFKALKRLAVPTLIFINKIDRLGVDIDEVLTAIRFHLSPDIWPLQAVTNEGSRQAVVEDLSLLPEDELIEMLSRVDEMLLLDYLEEAEISSHRLHQTLKVAIADRTIYPILFGSALNGIGITEMLKQINQLLPQFTPLDTDETSGIVFKVRRRNIKTMRECMIKLTAGQVELRGFIGADKITNLSHWQEGQVTVTKTLKAGDIGIVTGLNLPVGATFGQGIPQQGFSLGKPTLKVKVEADSPSQRQALLEALSLMMDNDPYLSYQLNEFNEDIYISLFGYVQLEIVQEQLKRDYGLEIQLSDPMTIYMETPQKMTEASVSMHEDGLPFSAGVGFRVEPLPQGSGIQYESEITTGYLKQRFQNGVEDGVYAYLDQGLHGWELTDMKITFISYQFNSVTSTPRDYRDLSPLILFEALKKAGTKLLWPISEYQLSTPTTYMGRAMSDLQRMKATMDDPTIEGDTCVIKGLIPIDLCPNYELTVHQYTGGLGHFESKVIGYEPAPAEMYKKRPRFKLDPANRGEYLLAKLKTV